MCLQASTRCSQFKLRGGVGPEGGSKEALELGGQRLLVFLPASRRAHMAV